MVTVTATVTDVTGAPDDRHWVVSSILREGHAGGTVVTAKQRLVTPVNGVLSVELEPGFAVVGTPDGQSHTVIVPEADVDLWDLIEAAVAVPPNTPAAVLAAAVASYLQANPVDPGQIGDAVSDYLDDNPLTVEWDEVTGKPASFTPAAHSHPASGIADSSSVGRSVLTAADAAAARTAIGAGTSDLALGASGTTACAGNDARLSDARTPTTHTHAASQISDSTALGRAALTAADLVALRATVGIVVLANEAAYNAIDPKDSNTLYVWPD